MRSYIDSFMRLCEYPDDARKCLLDAYDKITSIGDGLCNLVAEYEADYKIDYEAALSKMKEISLESGVHEYTGALLLFICYTRGLRAHYEREGISLDLFLPTVLDLRYKLDECQCVYGIVGSFVAKLFAGFFNLTRFALGRLQFEIVEFGGEYDNGEIKLTPESRVINVHIPRTLTPLDRKSTLESYRLAAEFFAPKLNGSIVFTCNSWLLFPRHKEMLKDGSNILEFMNDYDPVASGEYSNYNEIWRLFDKIYDGDPSHLPADSSLRRAYVEIISRGERTGWGKGVFAFKY